MLCEPAAAVSCVPWDIAVASQLPPGRSRGRVQTRRMWFLYYALADMPAAAKRAGQNFKSEVILQTSTQNF